MLIRVILGFMFLSKGLKKKMITVRGADGGDAESGVKRKEACYFVYLFIYFHLGPFPDSLSFRRELG